jgi:thiamine kinase-like enzyme
MSNARAGQLDSKGSADGLREVRLQLAVASVPGFGQLTAEDYEATRLDSYTNATYRIMVGPELFALRLAGTGTDHYIDRSAERQNAYIAAAAGVAAPVVWFDETDGTMLTRWVAGRTTTPDLLRQPEVGRRAASVLAQVHALTTEFRGRYDVFDIVRRYRTVLATSTVRLPSVHDELAGAVQQIEQAIRARPVRFVPCHNDPYPGNFIDTGKRIYLIDWEYAGMGDPMWDLADLSVEAEFGADDDERMLVTYYDGCVPPRAWSRLALFKVMCDFAWGVWSSVQLVYDNPTADYRKYGLDRFAGAQRQLAASEFGDHLAAVTRDA